MNQTSLARRARSCCGRERKNASKYNDSMPSAATPTTRRRKFTGWWIIWWAARGLCA